MLPPSLPPPGFGARGRAVRPRLLVVPRAERAAVPRCAAVVLRAVVERLVVPDARLAEPLVLLAAPADLARVVRLFVPVDADLAERAFGRAPADFEPAEPVDALRPPPLESLS